MVDADYNNDGCMDLLVLRGGWEFPMRKSLLRNNCNGTFTDVTDSSGLGQTVTATQTAAWADIDNDGYLDLFIGNENSPSQLFRNRGDGTFEDISHAAGIDKRHSPRASQPQTTTMTDTLISTCRTSAAPIFFITTTRPHLYRSRQAGRRAGDRYYSFATWFFDYDNDGWPDIFVNCYYSSVDEVMRSYLGLPPVGRDAQALSEPAQRHF